MKNLLKTAIDCFRSALDGIATALFIISISLITRLSIYNEPAVSQLSMKKFSAAKSGISNPLSWDKVNSATTKKSYESLLNKLRLGKATSFPDLSKAQQDEWPGTSYLDQA